MKGGKGLKDILDLVGRLVTVVADIVIAANNVMTHDVKGLSVLH